MHRRLGAWNLAAWLVTAIEAAPRIAESGFDLSLAALALVGVAGSVAWLRHRRALAAAVAVAYLLHYVIRMYVVQIEPLLVILPLPQATADAFYVLWSSPMGRLSHGEVLDAAAELWRECVMPLLQVAMLAAASRRSS